VTSETRCSRLIACWVLVLSSEGSPRDTSGPAPIFIDLLRRIDPAKDSVFGRWTMENGKLVSPVVARETRLQIPYAPGDEYDFTVVAERKKGIHNLQLGLASPNRQFMAILDADAMGDVAALEMVDGKWFLDNETTTRNRKVIQNDRPVTVLATVRKESVIVAVDGKVVLHFKGDLSRLSMNPTWAVPDKSALFIGAWDSQFVISKIQLRAVSGRGRSLR